ncbi:MAG: inorganic diphosphatase [Burkholderiales bacterium]|jgi:inorganic pyrophosphatase|nr:inorganic diphosphatase [Burkholderiales bacterium]
MNIDKLQAGDNIPEDFNVIIEIPANSSPVKYEVDKASGALIVDRFIGTAMSYPANYGFIPQTLSEDGDPIDVVVITPFPLIHGSVIKCRPIGVLKMEDESGIDSKILALPTKKSCAMYAHYEEISHLPSLIIDQIKFFFEHYKSLEKGKWVKVTGWEDVQVAKKEILAAASRYTK